MSGVAVINYLLRTNAPLLAEVPAARIKPGVIRLGTPKPAISVMSVSGNRRTTLALVEPNQIVTERVQVSVQVAGPFANPPGEGYPQQKRILALIVAAIPNTRGTVNGVKVEAILDDLVGPDLEEADAGLYMQSQDFMVMWKT